MNINNIKDSRPGYEYLLAYKLTVPIYDYTVEFCRRCQSPNFPNYPNLSSLRTFDQMIQAGRSGMQNLPEGYKQESLEGYIKLTGVTRGSLEELLKDYLAYARQNKIEVWGGERAKREIREIGKIWDIVRKNPTLPDSPNFPPLPDRPEVAINLLITLINQDNFLIDKLLASLEKKFIEEGGFKENLFRKRLEYRKNK